MRARLIPRHHVGKDAEYNQTTFVGFSLLFCITEGWARHTVSIKGKGETM